MKTRVTSSAATPRCKSATFLLGRSQTDLKQDEDRSAGKSDSSMSHIWPDIVVRGVGGTAVVRTRQLVKEARPANVLVYNGACLPVSGNLFSGRGRPPIVRRFLTVCTFWCAGWSPSGRCYAVEDEEGNKSCCVSARAPPSNMPVALLKQNVAPAVGVATL